MRRSLKTFLSVLMALAILCSLAVPAMAVKAENEVRIPVSIDLPYNVAGVELNLRNEDDLDMTWEKSASIKTLGSTPIAKKNGNWKFGVFNASNVIAPDEDGKLDMGTLVFTGEGATPVLMSAEHVMVVDKNTTKVGVYNFAKTGNVSTSGSTSVVSTGSAQASLLGDTKADTNTTTLNYSVAVQDVTDLATATFYLELDAATMEEPTFEARNGFNMLNNTVVLQDGKWICEVVIFNVEGLTANSAVSILSVSAASKGVEGTATAKLTGAVLSAYVGEGEDYVDTQIDTDTVSTTISKADSSTPGGDDDDDNNNNNHAPIDSRPTINGSAAGEKKEFPFKDVNRSDWFYDEVRDAWENDLIDGVTGTEFQPQKSLTVAEAIKLAAVLHQMDNEGKVTLSNGTGNWYDTYVDYAVENGVIDAKYQKYTRAQMDAYITRAEFVYIFHGAMDNYKVKNTVADNAIPDVKDGDFAADEIYEFYRAGICIGNDKLGTFLPNNVIKRCEVATILTRMYDTSARAFIYLP